jgi:hypothetical protein
VKRTPMPPRKSPLITRTELHSRVPLSRHSALAAVSFKMRDKNRQRVITEKQLGRVNGCGTCARCGRYGYVNGHELRRRSQGGNPAHPDCLLCVECNSWAAREPVTAAWTGWLISPKHPHDPALNNGEAWALNGDRVIFDLANQSFEQGATA